MFPTPSQLSNERAGNIEAVLDAEIDRKIKRLVMLNEYTRLYVQQPSKLIDHKPITIASPSTEVIGKVGQHPVKSKPKNANDNDWENDNNNDNDDYPLDNRGEPNPDAYDWEWEYNEDMKAYNKRKKKNGRCEPTPSDLPFCWPTIRVQFYATRMVRHANRLEYRWLRAVPAAQRCPTAQ